MSSNLACADYYANLYAECISPSIVYMDDEEYIRCKRKVLDFYNECEDVPTVTDIFYRAYDFNAEIIEKGFRIEIDQNPEFKELKNLFKRCPERANAEIDDIVDDMMQTFSCYELYDFIVDVLTEEKLAFEMFDSDDFMWSGEIEAKDIFGKGSKIIINNCQNILLSSYNKMPETIENYIPRKLTGKASVMFSFNTNSLLKIGGGV